MSSSSDGGCQNDGHVSSVSDSLNQGQGAASQQHTQNQEYDENEPRNDASQRPSKRRKTTAYQAPTVEDAPDDSENPDPTVIDLCETNMPLADNVNSQQELYQQLSESLGISKQKKERKKLGPRSKNARQAHEKRREKRAVAQAAKDSTAASKAKSPGSKGATAGSRPRASKKAAKATKGAKDAPEREPSPSRVSYNDRKRVADLLCNNTITDRMNQGDFGKAPVIQETRRKDFMMAELIASVPENVNRREVGIDKKDLLQASKNFGAGKVKGISGKWLFKGMKTALYHHQLLGADFMVRAFYGL